MPQLYELMKASDALNLQSKAYFGSCSATVSCPFSQFKGNKITIDVVTIINACSNVQRHMPAELNKVQIYYITITRKLRVIAIGY